MPDVLDYLTITDYINYLYVDCIEGTKIIGGSIIICMLIFTIGLLISFIKGENALGIEYEKLPIAACKINIGLFIVIVITTDIIYFTYKDNLSVKDFKTDFQEVRIVAEENGERLTYTGELRESTYTGIGLDELGAKVTVYSDKDEYIIAAKYCDKIHLNKAAIDKSLHLDNKNTEPDNMKILSNGSIEILDK